MGVEGCGCSDDGVGKGGDGGNKGGSGSVCRDSVDKGDVGEDGGDKGGERCGGDGSWLGTGEVGSKDLRRADKGARFVAGTGGRPGGDSGGEDSAGKDGGGEDSSGESGSDSDGETKLGRLVLGGGGAGLGLSDMGATGVQDVAVAITCRWPLGRLSIGGDKTGGVSRAGGGSGDVMGRAGV